MIPADLVNVAMKLLRRDATHATRLSYFTNVTGMRFCCPFADSASSHQSRLDRMVTCFIIWSPQSRLHHMVTSVSASSHGHLSLGFMTWSPQSRLHHMVTSGSASSYGHFSRDFITWALQSQLHNVVTSVSAS